MKIIFHKFCDKFNRLLERGTLQRTVRRLRQIQKTI